MSPLTPYLEHANITVPDIDAAIEFLAVIDRALVVRHDATAPGGYRWAHVGTDVFYIALEEPHAGPDTDANNARRPYHDFGVNHLAWVVEDFDAVIQRLEDRGYRKGMPVDPHPDRKRAYYFDQAGFEWEIVGYVSVDPGKRNSYD